MEAGLDLNVSTRLWSIYLADDVPHLLSVDDVWGVDDRCVAGPVHLSRLLVLSLRRRRPPVSGAEMQKCSRSAATSTKWFRPDWGCQWRSWPSWSLGCLSPKPTCPCPWSPAPAPSCTLSVNNKGSQKNFTDGEIFFFFLIKNRLSKTGGGLQNQADWRNGQKRLKKNEDLKKINAKNEKNEVIKAESFPTTLCFHTASRLSCIPIINSKPSRANP